MNYKFANLLGAPYRGGNVILHGSELLSPVGNRVSQVSSQPGSIARKQLEHGLKHHHSQYATVCAAQFNQHAASNPV